MPRRTECLQDTLRDGRVSTFDALIEGQPSFLFAAFYLGPRIAQADCSVEHQAAGR